MSSFEALDNIVKKAQNNPGLLQEFRRFSGKVFQFSLKEGDAFHLSIGSDGTPTLERGNHPSPSATITASDSALADILTGKADAVQSFFMGKVKVSGDLMSVQGLVNLLKKIR
ncbi:MAG: SCP2 sterol-binding domain-containing protein [Conexivisphaera sp.]